MQQEQMLYHKLNWEGRECREIISIFQTANEHLLQKLDVQTSAFQFTKEEVLVLIAQSG